MKREDIEKAAKHIIDEYNLNPEYGSYFEHGFIDGAEWRIESVWHRDEEEAEVGSLILIKSRQRNVFMVNANNYTCAMNNQ